jgi:hypothetical protein
MNINHSSLGDLFLSDSARCHSSDEVIIVACSFSFEDQDSPIGVASSAMGGVIRAHSQFPDGFTIYQSGSTHDYEANCFCWIFSPLDESDLINYLEDNALLGDD